MKLPLSEPTNPNYIYVTSDNIVHLLMPIVSGTRIGLDNTCKAVYALQEFFGKSRAQSNQKTARKALEGYKLALESDLLQLPLDSDLIKPKQERLTQINHYLAILAAIEKTQGLDSLKSGFPTYPEALESMLQNKEQSNVAVMTLRPSGQDIYLRMEAANPIFSVAHDSSARNRANTTSELQQALVSAFNRLTIEPQDNRLRLLSSVIAELKTQGKSDFKSIQSILTTATEALFGVAVDFTKDEAGQSIDEASIKAWMGLDDRTTPAEYIDALLGYCAKELFDTIDESPFNRFAKAEEWSIATQFLLAMVNIHCAHQGLSKLNFGQALDNNSQLSQSLAATLSDAQKNHRSPEDALFKWLNQNKAHFDLEKALTEEHQTTIKKEFMVRFSEINQSENSHKDEFLLINPVRKGYFCVHQGSICASFADFAASPVFDLTLTQDQKEFLGYAQKHFSALDIDIPHQNPLVKAELEINLAALDTNALQALYDKIKTYKDQKVKMELLRQLKQERPDFKPQINVQAFLTLIAQGREPEAEKLLQDNPDMAQDLLTAHNIPFNDYQDRTFTCTAYEYAYWAKDTYMCRMLEKHMDDNTKQEILKRVQQIEGLSQGPQLFQGQNGLTYQDKYGKTYQEAHFDLTPLIKAYEAYLTCYYNKVQTGGDEGDWSQVDAAWLKVGLAQRDCPAHVIQEYCHKKRSFYPGDGKKNDDGYQSLFDSRNAKGLTRDVAFYNFDSRAMDSCFPLGANSGLGFSVALLRAQGGSWALGGRSCVWGGRLADADLSAIKALGEVRTADLKQSLVNLSTPSNSPGSRPGGI